MLLKLYDINIYSRSEEYILINFIPPQNCPKVFTNIQLCGLVHDPADIQLARFGKDSKVTFLVSFNGDNQVIGDEDIFIESDREPENERCLALAGIGGVG